MRKKALLLSAIGLVLLGAVIAAALNAVFTVTDIVVDYSPVSSAGIKESFELQEILDQKYVGKSTTFLDLEDVEASISEFPAFKLLSIEKIFPRKVSIRLSERKETYAFRKEDGMYAILDEDGAYLYDKETNENRRGGENILLEGFPLSTVSSGELPSGDYFQEAHLFVSVFLKGLSNVRSNLASIRLTGTENPLAGSHLFRLQMREGLIIDVYGPKISTEEKAESALEKYLSLSDAQRLYGFFDIIDALDGSFTVSEHRPDTPVGV